MTKLLVAEANRGPRQQHPRRTFWVEEDGAWGLINEEVDEDVFTPSADSILWAAQSPEVGSASAFQMEDAGEDSVWYDGTYEWSYHTDGEWYAPLDDGSYVAYSEFKPWLDIEEVSYHDSALAKELADSYAVITDKVRTFQEAKHALHQKGKTRGYFKPKGKGKNFRKGFQKGKPGVLAAFPFQTKSSSVGSSGGSSIVNTPGYKGCFICGDKTHEFRRCPKRQEQKGMSGKGGKAVYMVTECTSQPAGSSNAVSSQIETKVDDSVLHDHGGDAELERCILAAVEATEGMDRLRFAVLDTGATETVGSMDALDRILSVRQERFGEEEVYIDPSQNKEFKFGNGQTRTAASFVHVPQTIGNQKTTLGVYALDVPQIPVLLGIKTLKRLGAIIDVDSETLEFKKRFPGMQVQLICGQNGHLLLDLCSNWDVRERHNPYPLSLHQPESFPPHITEKGSAADVAEALSDEDSIRTMALRIKIEVMRSPVRCHSMTSSVKLSLRTAKKFPNRMSLLLKCFVLLRKVTLRTQVVPSRLPAMADKTMVPEKAQGAPSVVDLTKEKAVSKAKAKVASKKEGTPLDYARTVGPDPRDPRLEGPPCHGHHVPEPPGRGSRSGSNAWAKWVTCSQCRLRLEYTPRVGAPGHHRSPGPLPPDAVDMTEEKAENLVPEDLTLEAVQKQKAALEHKGYVDTPPEASKKTTKRDHALPSEVQEKNSPSTPSEASWVVP